MLEGKYELYKIEHVRKNMEYLKFSIFCNMLACCLVVVRKKSKINHVNYRTEEILVGTFCCLHIELAVSPASLYARLS